MSNILHEIKRGFVILGFTGPLSSGCTTSALFFTNEINKYINNKNKKHLPKIEATIKTLYNEIDSLKKSLKLPKVNNVDAKRLIILRKIQIKSEKLKEYLHLRETLSALKDYNISNFKYISMTDLLMKITIEKLMATNSNKLDKDQKTLKSKIIFDKAKFAIVKEVNTLLEERKIYKITEAKNNIYEEYLNYVSEFRQKLKSYLKTDIGKLLQDFGDNARKCGNPLDYKTDFNKKKPGTLFVIAKEANNIIKFYRNRQRSEFQNKSVYKEFVIEAFRNPYEVEYFRNRYYEFFLFSLFSPADVRMTRANWNPKRDKRDRGVGLGKQDFFKQNVSECVHLSDVAVNNITGKPRLHQKLSKYYSLICQPGCITPSSDEMFMHQAYSMSVKSNCISRQVGAVVIGPKGYIVGAGWNDVGAGQVACGLRKFKDITKASTPIPIAVRGEEAKFYKHIKNSGKGYPQHSYCYKDEYSKFKTFSKIEKLKKEDKALGEWEDKNSIKPAAMKSLANLVVNNFSPKRLEYCRALHAEENAILQNSILGGMGIEGGTIYTTTFPCELCAKKIYQSKIKKVVFTEPYPESISEDVFFKDGSHIIHLHQFEGVKSHSYYRLYKATVDKKEFQLQERLF